ncbi:MAG: aminopeptidase [Gammaproteobacteria bacterium]|nr:aminopeptidase [Gammaproteobacteria bacterium]
MPALFMLLLAMALGGCANLGYYAQAVGGHWQVVRAAQPVDALLADPATPAPLKARLRRAGEILRFAESEMGLEPGGSYRRFADLERSHVLWNVFAAPPFSLQAHQWCHPFAGCTPYRGYFSRDAALRAAQRFTDEGLETYVGGVAAYSTLGWFDDPLLSTFIHWPEAELAELLIHETAHRRLWVANDVPLNEAFASFVGEAGARQWFAVQGRSDEFAAHRQRQAEWRRLTRLLMEAKTRLATLYGQTGATALEAAKAHLIGALRACYQANRPRLGGGRYDRVVERVNNAFLASLATYRHWQPAFAALHRRHPDWAGFFAAVDELAQLEADARETAFAALRDQQVAKAGDDHRADQVQCEALAGHDFNGDSAGAEHDDVGRRGHRQHEGAGGAHGGGDHQESGVHARAERRGSEDGHQQRGGGGVARGLGQEGDRQADHPHHRQHVPGGDAAQEVADGFAQAR